MISFRTSVDRRMNPRVSGLSEYGSNSCRKKERSAHIGSEQQSDIQLLLQILKRLISQVSERFAPQIHQICSPSPKILTLREVRRWLPAAMTFAEVLPQ